MTLLPYGKSMCEWEADALVHDDGWAQGTNLTSKVSGAFPLACVLRGE